MSAATRCNNGGATASTVRPIRFYSARPPCKEQLLSPWCDGIMARIGPCPQLLGRECGVEQTTYEACMQTNGTEPTACIEVLETFLACSERAVDRQQNERRGGS
eukprot:SAG11_NODE_7501_length_1136_cov_2.873674_2_plen_104_part_00